MDIEPPTVQIQGLIMSSKMRFQRHELFNCQKSRNAHGPLSVQLEIQSTPAPTRLLKQLRIIFRNIVLTQVHTPYTRHLL